MQRQRKRSPWANTGAPSNPADGPTLTRTDRWLRPCKGRRKVVCWGHFLWLTAAVYHSLHLTCVRVCVRTTNPVMQHFACPRGPLLQTVPAALVLYWWNICKSF